MEFTKEFIETNKLDEGQVIAINKAVNDNEAVLQKDWEGKANENAEGQERSNQATAQSREA